MSTTTTPDLTTYTPQQIDDVLAELGHRFAVLQQHDAVLVGGFGAVDGVGREQRV